MLRLYTTATAIMFTLLLVLMLIMRSIGTLAPEHPMLTSIERCDDLPCWLHINIDTATPAEARAIFEAHGYRTFDNTSYLAPVDTGLCQLTLSEGFINIESEIASLQVGYCNNLTLGDVWQVLGTPQLVANDCFDNWVLWYRGSIAVFVNSGLTPYSPVFQVAFFNLGAFGVSPYGVPWHGFTTQWRYNQLEGNIRGC